MAYFTTPGRPESIPGNNAASFNVKCAIDQTRICPAKQRLVELYVGNAGNNGVTQEVSLRDRALLTAKLAEYSIPYSGGVDCNSIEPEQCGRRVGMNSQPSRVSAIHSARRLRSILGRKG
jgi:hypothetical protein